MNNASQVWLITGGRNQGKTQLLQLVTAELRSQLPAGTITGLLSPALRQAGRKVAIDLLDIASGERRPLAQLRRGDASSLTTRRWSFNQGAIDWGNFRLQQMAPSPIFVVDELGPLEFERGLGLQAALGQLDSMAFQLALVVIRPSLLAAAIERWRPQTIINLEDYADAETAAIQLNRQIMSLMHEKGTKLMNTEESGTIRIAFASDDGQTISSHFGRAQQYAVVTLQDGEISQRETRPKFSPHGSGEKHDHGQAGAEDRHQRMVGSILDCQLVIARGMGQGAYGHLENAGLQILLTDSKSIDEAVQAYQEGSLSHQPDRLHQHHGNHNHGEGSGH